MERGKKRRHKNKRKTRPSASRKPDTQHTLYNNTATTGCSVTRPRLMTTKHIDIIVLVSRYCYIAVVSYRKKGSNIKRKSAQKIKRKPHSKH